MNPHTEHVAPFTGAWIEIRSRRALCRSQTVAPFTGAWIEIYNIAANTTGYGVAPFTGAWIEIGLNDGDIARIESHPSRVRGLKLKVKTNAICWNNVAPFTGAWIEIPRIRSSKVSGIRRTLHGCVD